MYERRFKRLAEQSGYASSETYNYNQAVRSDAERGMTAAQRRKEHERRQKEYEASSAFNALPFDKKIARKQAITNAKETVKATAKSVGAAIKSNPYFKKIFNPITIAAGACAAVFNLLAKSAKQAAISAQALTLANEQSTKRVQDAQVYQQLNRATSESTAAFEKLKLAIGTGTADIKSFGAGLAEAVDSIGTWVGWFVAKFNFANLLLMLQGKGYTDTFSEAQQAHEDAYVNANREKYITTIFQNLLQQGVGTDRANSLALAGYNSAIAAARKTKGNEGLSTSEILNSAAFKTYIERYTQMASGVNSNIFEGAAAQMLGSSYVPGMIRSQEEQAKVLEYILRQLAETNTVEQQADLMSTWENAGTILNNIAKNLYSFDEVISQDAIKVNDEKAGKILEGVIKDYDKKDDLLSNLRDDVRDIKNHQLSTDGVTRLDDNSSGGSSISSDSDNLGPTGSKTLNELLEKYGLTDVYNDAQQGYAKKHAGTGDAADQQTDAYADYLFDKYSKYGSGYLGGTTYNADTGYWYDVYGGKHKVEPKTGYEDIAHGQTTMRGNQFGMEEDGVFKAYENETLPNGWSIQREVGRSSASSDRASSNSFLDFLGRVADNFVNILTGTHGLNPTQNANLNAVNPHFAAGGVGRSPVTNATLFENGAEAIVPLDSQEGINYMANALREAGLTGGGQSNINVNIYGADLSDERTRDQIARDIGERIQTITLREGGI